MKNIKRLPGTWIKEKIHSVLEGGDILFVVPPFTSLYSPAFGPHILRDIARGKGFKTDILYLNILLASMLGVEFAESLNVPGLFHYWSMIQERLFARSAYGLPPMGKSPELCFNQLLSTGGDGNLNIRDYEDDDLDLETLWEVEKLCKFFVDEVVSIIASLDYKITGFTMRMGQTNCAIAIINGIKRLRPGIIAVVGGTNCLGEMAQGIASLSDSIDYIFSGESENSFGLFLDGFSRHRLPRERIITGKPLLDLDTLPLTRYENYFAQLRGFLGEEAPKETGLWYETSRGCWWGEKTKCTFCGMDDEILKYRQKSIEKVLHDLQELGKRHPGTGVVMADYIMPLSFQKELLPILAEENEENDYPPVLFYCVKANLDFKDLLEFKNAKIKKINPGMESLSTGILESMKKGVTAGENLYLLRNARSLDLAIHWFLLWGIPGDTRADYEELYRILPLIRHLHPPVKFLCILMERFSRYFKTPLDYEIKNFRPWAVYRMIYPEWADVDRLAYYYTGEYPSGAHEDPALIREITGEVGIWQKTWKKASLFMTPSSDYYMIYDGRGIRKPQKYMLDASGAGEIMTCGIYSGSGYRKWAVEENLGLVVDSRYVPLVTASPRLLLKFEEKEKESC